MPAQYFFDFLVFLPINILYYPFSGQTLFGVVDRSGPMGLDKKELEESNSLRAMRARSFLKMTAASKSTNSFLGDSGKYNPDQSWAKSYGTPKDKWKADNYYDAYKIIDNISPEDFEEAMADAELTIDDLDLSETEVVELRENGYISEEADSGKQIQAPTNK